MPPDKAQKRQGVRLILGGAPNSPHTVPPLRGLYRPDVPTPVGQPGDVYEDLDEIKKLVQEHSGAVELVEISAGDVREAEAQSKTDLAEARNGLVEAKKDGRAEDDDARFADERNAVKEAK